MANPVCEVLLTEGALQPPKAEYCGSGAVVDFFGVVRPLENGRPISGIDYEAHSAMASHQLKSIAAEAIEKFDLHTVVVHHRIGFVPIGEPSVFVRTASGHRGESYSANEWLMDQLKTRVPIWKHPKFDPAGEKWPQQMEANAGV